MYIYTGALDKIAAVHLVSGITLKYANHKEPVQDNQPKAYLYGLAAVLLWSTVATAFKITASYLAPVQLLFYASLASIIILRP